VVLDLTYVVRVIFSSYACRVLISPPLNLPRLDNGAALDETPTFTSTIAQLTRTKSQVEGSYNPVLESCIVLHTRKGLVNCIGALVVDVVLCVAMLIGLLRQAHRSSTGIWHLLYRQVMLRPFFCLGC
jgi:hypothetical protein